jgi:hypothetical protein
MQFPYQFAVSSKGAAEAIGKQHCRQERGHRRLYRAATRSVATQAAAQGDLRLSRNLHALSAALRAFCYRISAMPIMNVIAWPMLRATLKNDGLDRQSSFRKTIGNPPNVFFVLEGLSSEMLAEGVSCIDLFELSPDPTSFFDITEMTKS